MNNLIILSNEMFVINLIVIVSTSLYGVNKISQSYTQTQMKIYREGTADNLLIGITNVLVSMACLFLILAGL
jgi:hypothetical protein